MSEQERISVENKRIKAKLTTMESSLQGQRFQSDYEKHKKYKQNMQRFFKEGSS
jgi:regulator of replication initiation timing